MNVGGRQYGLGAIAELGFIEPPLDLPLADRQLFTLNRLGRTSDDDAYPRYVLVAVGAFRYHRLRFRLTFTPELHEPDNFSTFVSSHQ